MTFSFDNFGIFASLGFDASKRSSGNACAIEHERVRCTKSRNDGRSTVNLTLRAARRNTLGTRER